MARLSRLVAFVFRPFTSCFRPPSPPVELAPPSSQRIGPPMKMRSKEGGFIYPSQAAKLAPFPSHFSTETASSLYRPSLPDVKDIQRGKRDNISNIAIHTNPRNRGNGLNGSVGLDRDRYSSGATRYSPSVSNYSMQEKKPSLNSSLLLTMPSLPPPPLPRRPLPHNSTLRLDMDTRPFRNLQVDTSIAQASPIFTDELASSPSEMSVSEYPRYDDNGEQIPRSGAKTPPLPFKKEIENFPTLPPPPPPPPRSKDDSKDRMKVALPRHSSSRKKRYN